MTGEPALEQLGRLTGTYPHVLGDRISNRRRSKREHTRHIDVPNCARLSNTGKLKRCRPRDKG